MTTSTWYGTPVHGVSWPTGDWESAANWAPSGGSGTVPGAGAVVVLSLAHTGGVHYQVDTSSPITVASLTINAGTGLVLQTADTFTVSGPNHLTIASGGSVDMQVSGASLEISGPVKNAGEIDGGTLLANGTVSLVSGGDVILAGGGFITGATGGGTDTLVNIDNTISGDGTLGNDGASHQLIFVNAEAGTVDAGGSDILTVSTGNNFFKNAGLMEATGNGRLQIQNTASVTNSGTIAAFDSATVAITGSTIVNTGTLEASGGGTLTDQDTLINEGSLLVQTGGTMVFSGAIRGAGTAHINDGGTLEFEAGVKKATVRFGTNAHGSLILDDSPDFHGTVAGLNTTSQVIDFTDISFASLGALQYAGNTIGGVLTVTDGSTTAHIALTGNYTLSSFKTGNDGNGGTLVYDPPLPAAPSDLAALMENFAGPASAPSDALTAGFGRNLMDHLALAL